MNPLEQLKKIKALVFNEAPAAPTEPAPVQLMEYTLEDGTVVMIDKLEAGGVVSIGDAPAPAGDHKLADGTVVTVGEGGVISAVVAPAAPVSPEQTPEDLKLETPQQMMEAIAKFADPETQPTSAPELQKMAVILKAVFESVFGWQIREAEEKATRDAAIEVYKQGFSKQAELNKEFYAALQTLIKEPDTAPTQQPNTFRRITAQTKDERIKSFSNSISNILKTNKNGI